MDKKFLVINAGSSSLKFSLYEMPEGKEIVNGYVEKIGLEDSFYTLKFNGKKVEKTKTIMSHNEAVNTMLEVLISNKFIKSISEITGVGHRVVHGGEKYSDSVIIDDKVISDIKELTKFATLHHPGEISGILSMQECLPGVPQVATFDTAYHQTMPEECYLYGVPYKWYKENGVRKYGAHGTSYKYITEKVQERYMKKDVNVIVCHLGSGASIACIKNGVSHDTTMGLTPLDGILMGTRCGNIDSSIIEYICKERNLTIDQVMNILNKESGLIGQTGKNDFRDIEKMANEGNIDAIRSIKMLVNSIVSYIGKYYFYLNGKIDAIVFTAGIGENSMFLREQVINRIANVVNIKLNKDINDNIARFKDYQSGVITTEDSAFEVLVIPTDEESVILNDTYNLCLKNK